MAASGVAAISVTSPLFLIASERRLAALGEAAPAAGSVRLTAPDLIGLAIVAASVLALWAFLVRQAAFRKVGTGFRNKMRDTTKT